MLKVPDEINDYIIKPVFTFKKESDGYGQYKKWQVFQLLPEFNEPHGIFFGCDNNFVGVFNLFKALPDIPQVINTEYMVVIKIHRVITAAMIIEVGSKWFGIGYTTDQQDFRMF